MKELSNLSIWLSRFALFLVYFWFGILKLVSISPANPLVSALLAKTLPFISFDTFIILLGIFEVLIGMLFLMPKFLKLALVFIVVHMLVTIMPLLMLPEITWQGFMAPTLEGQYIIKNILIIAAAFSIYTFSNREEKL